MEARLLAIADAPDKMFVDKFLGMPANNFFVLLCSPCVSALTAEQERLALARLLATPLMKERFYQATELVDRNHITHNRARIKEELSKRPMRSFRFVINKN